MIVVTGTAGFIGSNIVRKLNALGRRDIVCADVDIGKYLGDAKIWTFLHKDFLLQWLYLHSAKIECIIHMGACTDTTSSDRDMMMNLNYEFTKALWLFCDVHKVKLVYASSAATYGDGSNGYDDVKPPTSLKPLNVYAESKQKFDLWALKQKAGPRQWAGLKFFNVYGPREEHKGKMASMAYHSYVQIRKNGQVKLFEGKAKDAERDFIYVDDVVDIVLFFALQKIKSNGLYNVGTGEPRKFIDVARLMFEASGKKEDVAFIPMPKKMEGKYQYFTKAETDKLRDAGYKKKFTSLEDGVKKYAEYLKKVKA
jgi:ADP-L-glycero-D-manno-heptose 6-epimerase